MLIILFSINHLQARFQVLLCNTNNSTSVICMHTVKDLNSSIWPIDGILTGTTTLGQRGCGWNGNDSVFYTPQISRADNSTSDAVKCHTQHIPIGSGGLTPLQWIQWKFSKLLQKGGCDCYSDINIVDIMIDIVSYLVSFQLKWYFYLLLTTCIYIFVTKPCALDLFIKYKITVSKFLEHCQIKFGTAEKTIRNRSCYHGV